MILSRVLGRIGSGRRSVEIGQTWVVDVEVEGALLLVNGGVLAADDTVLLLRAQRCKLRARERLRALKSERQTSSSLCLKRPA